MEMCKSGQLQVQSLVPHVCQDKAQAVNASQCFRSLAENSLRYQDSSILPSLSTELFLHAYSKLMNYDLGSQINKAIIQPLMTANLRVHAIDVSVSPQIGS